MTTRRAVSPVIATVILIAVAVALGIAVAVWAGALTGGLQKQEKLIINAYETNPVAGATLTISVTNQSPGSITITQVLFNQQPVPLMTSVASFTPVAVMGAAPWTLVSAANGQLSILGATLPTVPKSGITYPISIVTAAGNTYPSTITWP